MRFGFVGRLRSEKNVRMLADLEKEFFKAGKTNFKFLIVGEGDERAFLEKNMQTAELTGFLEGEQLSEAYANMDVFVFPSETDAYGNVAAGSDGFERSGNRNRSRADRNLLCGTAKQDLSPKILTIL